VDHLKCNFLNCVENVTLPYYSRDMVLRKSYYLLINYLVDYPALETSCLNYRTVLSRGTAGSTSDGPDGQSTFVKESDLYISLVTPWHHPDNFWHFMWREVSLKTLNRFKEQSRRTAVQWRTRARRFEEKNLISNERTWRI